MLPEALQIGLSSWLVDKDIKTEFALARGNVFYLRVKDDYEPIALRIINCGTNDYFINAVLKDDILDAMTTYLSQKSIRRENILLVEPRKFKMYVQSFKKHN